MDTGCQKKELESNKTHQDLWGSLRHTNLKRKQVTETSFINRVLVVCSALVDMSPSVVPL